MTVAFAMPAYNRPDYTKKSLEAIHKLWGFDNHPIYVSVDQLPDKSHDSGVVDAVKSFGITPFLADKRLGCNGNVQNALRVAWADPEVDVVVCVEDDIILSPIVLKYVEWAANEFKDAQQVRTISLWSHRTNPWKPGDPYTNQTPFHIQFENHFNCWGWATWRDRWEEMDQEWSTMGDSHEGSWDQIISNNLKGRVECSPSISYANNIGKEGGTHRDSAWPGFLVDGFISELTPVSFQYEGMPVAINSKPAVFVILGAFGDIWMVCKAVPPGSIIATDINYASIVYEMFPDLEVYELENLGRNDLETAMAMCHYKYPTRRVILCQQDGQGQDVAKPYRNYQQFQVAHASI